MSTSNASLMFRTHQSIKVAISHLLLILY